MMTLQLELIFLFFNLVKIWSGIL